MTGLFGVGTVRRILTGPTYIGEHQWRKAYKDGPPKAAATRQGKTGCEGRAIQMDRLDHLVAEHLEQRLLHPKRLEDLLAAHLDRREERDARLVGTRQTNSPNGRRKRNSALSVFTTRSKTASLGYRTRR